MVERVAATIERYRMFAPGQRVGVAVSGGADSVCLLHVLRELAPRWALRLSILHVDHCLRGEDSAADARFVRELGAGLGLEVLCHEADVRRISQLEGDNLEQAARNVRQEFYLGLLRSDALDRVALGHTRSDQAETVLFRFLRGSGAAGLAGIRPVTQEGLVRPLVEITRSEVRQFLAERGLPWREDASNQDLAFARNRIRHELLPALERDWNPALSEILAGVAKVARDEEEYWRGLVDHLVKGNLIHRPPAVLFRASWLSGLPPAVARRVTRRALALAKGDLRRIDLRHVECILELASAATGSGHCALPGLEAARSFDWVRVAPPAPGRYDYQKELCVPGRYPLPNTGWELVLEFVSAGADCGYNMNETKQLDWGRISGNLQVRNWRPGDRYRPCGHASEVKVNSLFQQARVPSWDRGTWPVITCGGEIVWVGRFGPAAGFAAPPASGPAFVVHGIHNSVETWDPGSGRERPIGRGSVDPAGGGDL
jgi:tRNA(Ile)-lysidine synthase